MAKPTLAESVIGKENYEKIGTFKEATGGGTPIPKGETLKEHPEIKRVKQPRDEQGRFTFNSMNRKPLKFKYHARTKSGKKKKPTVPPILRDVKFKYAIKAKDKIVANGNVYYAGQYISKSDFINAFREYKGKEGFGKVEKEVKGKRGRRSETEREAIAGNKQGLLTNYASEKRKVDNHMSKKVYRKK